MSVIVYGPAGCGKTRFAKRLMKHFGMSRVIDEWKPGDEIPDNCLMLTEQPCKGGIPFTQVAKELGIKVWKRGQQC